MRPGMTVWPGDPPFLFTPSCRIADGAGSNVSAVSFSTHTGTHVDAPWHFEDRGKKLDQIDISVFFGNALLIDAPGVDTVTAADLGPAPLPPRVLIRTRNSAVPVESPFLKEYVALAADAAQRLVDENVKLVGVDGLSVAPYKQPGQDTHHILLSNDVLVVEGLRLFKFSAGVYSFVVAPLALCGADGAPCRAFIGQEDPRE